MSRRKLGSGGKTIRLALAMIGALLCPGLLPADDGVIVDGRTSQGLGFRLILDQDRGCFVSSETYFVKRLTLQVRCGGHIHLASLLDSVDRIAVRIDEPFTSEMEGLEFFDAGHLAGSFQGSQFVGNLTVQHGGCPGNIGLTGDIFQDGGIPWTLKFASTHYRVEEGRPAEIAFQVEGDDRLFQGSFIAGVDILNLDVLEDLELSDTYFLTSWGAVMSSCVGGATELIQYFPTYFVAEVGTVDDHIEEGTERTPLGLFTYGATSGHLADPRSATLTIVDNNEPAGPPPPPQLGEPLRLGDFSISAGFRTFTGQVGSAVPVQLTEDTGYFWFFHPSNVEVILKVIDGRSFNNHYWVFYGALSNLEYWIQVDDLELGGRKTYYNAPGAIASVGDIEAFTDIVPIALEVGIGSKNVVGPQTSVGARSIPSEPWETSHCEFTGEQLCLRNGRFALEMTWEAFNGTTGTGSGVQISSDTGYFWFFGPSNAEVMVKVLDGRSFNGNFWIYYGSLSNVAFDLQITDLETHVVHHYSNRLGSFGSVADIGSFPSP